MDITVLKCDSTILPWYFISSWQTLVLIQSYSCASTKHGLETVIGLGTKLDTQKKWSSGIPGCRCDAPAKLLKCSFANCHATCQIFILLLFCLNWSCRTLFCLCFSFGRRFLLHSCTLHLWQQLLWFHVILLIWPLLSSLGRVPPVQARCRLGSCKCRQCLPGACSVPLAGARCLLGSRLVQALLGSRLVPARFQSTPFLIIIESPELWWHPTIPPVQGSSSHPGRVTSDLPSSSMSEPRAASPKSQLALHNDCGNSWAIAPPNSQADHTRSWWRGPEAQEVRP